MISEDCLTVRLSDYLEARRGRAPDRAGDAEAPRAAAAAPESDDAAREDPQADEAGGEADGN